MASSDSTTDGTPPQAPPLEGSALSRVMNHMMSNKIEAALWLTRMFTVVSTAMFLLPVFGNNPYSSYQRALLSNAATSALRLHQRKPRVQLTRVFFTEVFLEDSAHYLFFCLIFVTSFPITMALVPVFLFALMHATKYTKALLDQVGPNSFRLLRNLIGKVEEHQRNLLRFIACNEIFLMPAIIFMIFTGNASLLLPFVYYRFLSLRYASQRNPYCRQLFYELRVTVEHYSARPSCPAFLRNMTYKAIATVSRLAPDIHTAPAQ